jgi:hypothetical protein
MPALPKQYTQQAGLPFFCVLKPFRQYVLAFLQHYAAKTLENVFGLGGPWAQQLATTETMHNLAQVGFALNGVGLGLSSPISTLLYVCPLQIVDGRLPDVLRGTAASALCRLLRCQPSCLEDLVNMGGVDLIAAGKLRRRCAFNASSPFIVLP